jgi:DNA-dependent metalloprotease WSS1
MSSAFLAQLPFIGTTSTLGWQNDALAQSYMDHILQRARVLLPRRGWRVGVIKEFYPRGASLLGLNVNAGSEVCIRFRVPGKRNVFLPFHEVLCTALHEFTHCVHSRHDRAFWNLYYDLVKECEALEATMIQQGKQLYPEAAYLPSNSAASSCTHGEPRRGVESKKSVASPPTSTNGGRRIGGSTSSGGCGAATATRGRGGITTATVTARPGRGAKPTAAVSSSSADGNRTATSGLFPGEGRRLGAAGGLHNFGDSSSSCGATPTRDALRRILAAAAERRLQSTRPTAGAFSDGGTTSASPLSRQATVQQAVVIDVVSEEGDEDEEEGGGEVPDHIPVSQSAVDDSDGSWRCPRCGFCNEAGAHTCQFCDNVDDNDNGEEHDGGAASLSGDERCAEWVAQPPVKKNRSEVTGTTGVAADVPAGTLATANTHRGISKDDAVEISDDD